MARGGDKAVQEVKARINLADLARRYVTLRRMGTRWMAPCPFHQETKPSFSINEEEGFFYCFGCQASGDVIDFYCRVNGLEFREGLEQLAQEAGVELFDTQEGPEAREEREFKRACLAMYRLAETHFQDNLRAPAGKACREYLASRGIAQGTVEAFRLGWSLPGWHDLEQMLRSKGFEPVMAARAGLLSRNEKGRIFDLFRERLIFPISNLSNQVIAFGGRVLISQQEPKYINSSDTAVYKKGAHLYGLAQARRAISQTKTAVLTEGYMDVLTLHQFGYANACGVLGTALTPNQVQRLAGFCSNVDLLFDGDSAGRKAALRSSEMILARGLRCRVVDLPDGEDVDSLLQGCGREALDAVLSVAKDGFDFCLETVVAQCSPRELIEWAQGFLRKLEQPELRAYYLPRIAAGLGLSEAELRRTHGGGGGTPQAAPRPRETAPSRPGAHRERWLLDFAVRYPQHVPALEARGAACLVTTDFGCGLWGKLAGAQGGEMPPDLSEEEKRFWVKSRLQKADMDENEEGELLEVCSFLEKESVARQTRSFKQKLKSGEAADLTDEDKQRLKALQETLGRDDG